MDGNDDGDAGWARECWNFPDYHGCEVRLLECLRIEALRMLIVREGDDRALWRSAVSIKLVCAFLRWFQLISRG